MASALASLGRVRRGRGARRGGRARASRAGHGPLSRRAGAAGARRSGGGRSRGAARRCRSIRRSRRRTRRWGSCWRGPAARARRGTTCCGRRRAAPAPPGRRGGSSTTRSAGPRRRARCSRWRRWRGPRPSTRRRCASSASTCSRRAAAISPSPIYLALDARYPRRADIVEALGVALIERGRAARAARTLERAIALDASASEQPPAPGDRLRPDRSPRGRACARPAGPWHCAPTTRRRAASSRRCGSVTRRAPRHAPATRTIRSRCGRSPAGAAARRRSSARRSAGSAGSCRSASRR